MGYGGYLKELLGPLGVYDLSEGSLSGGEREQLAKMLEVLHRRSREERKEGFCHVREQMAAGEISAEESL